MIGRAKDDWIEKARLEKILRQRIMVLHIWERFNGDASKRMEKAVKAETKIMIENDWEELNKHD